MKKARTKQPITKGQEEIKNDLKHDTMEFAASTEGEDKLDFDDENYEEEEITPGELEGLVDETPEELAYAEAAADTDQEGDSDNLREEDWEDDLPGGDKQEEEHKHERHKRK